MDPLRENFRSSDQYEPAKTPGEREAQGRLRLQAVKAGIGHVEPEDRVSMAVQYSNVGDNSSCRDLANKY